MVVTLQFISLKSKAYIRRMNQLEFLEKIVQNLDHSSLAYTAYLKNGKTYQHACELRKYNTSMLNLLSENNQLLSQDLQNDARALTDHLNSWTEKWDALKQQLDPALNDEFVFENEHRFPREAARRFEEEFQRLKGISN